MSPSGASHKPETGEQDALRARMYRLPGRFLAGPPSGGGLKAVAGMTGDDSGLGRAILAFAHIASRTSTDQVVREYQDLFTGGARGELLPYGSYYLTGFLHENFATTCRGSGSSAWRRPSRIRGEPEDHIAALFEMMSGMITGNFGEVAALDDQKRFFETHAVSWAKHFFGDLEGAKSSVLYAALGSAGRVFMDIGEVAFTMD